MKVLRAYSINFASLADGKHEFDYEIDQKFFDQFEDSFIKKGNVKVNMIMNKSMHCLELDFEVEGVVETVCDICAEDFDLPIVGEEMIIVKMVTEPPTENNELNVIYISLGETAISVAQMIYELIILSIPIQKTHPRDENDNLTCNPKVLEYLKISEENVAKLAEEQKNTNPIWDELKKLKK